MSENGEGYNHNTEFELPDFRDNLDDVVGDGHIKEGDRNMAIFPMISTCVPVVITDANNAIVEIIHANEKWTSEKIKEELKRHEGSGTLQVAYADRKATEKSIEQMLKKHVPRRELLEWLDKTAGEEGVITKKTVLPADRHLRHIGYIKERGFVNITLRGRGTS